MVRYHYFVEIRLDTNSNWPLIGDERKYLDLIDKYHALGTGHDKRGTCSLEFNSRKQIKQEDLQKELGGLEIITFTEKPWHIKKMSEREMIKLIKQSAKFAGLRQQSITHFG